MLNGTEVWGGSWRLHHCNPILNKLVCDNSSCLGSSTILDVIWGLPLLLWSWTFWFVWISPKVSEWSWRVHQLFVQCLIAFSLPVVAIELRQVDVYSISFDFKFNQSIMVTWMSMQYIKCWYTKPYKDWMVSNQFNRSPDKAADKAINVGDKFPCEKEVCHFHTILCCTE